MRTVARAVSMLLVLATPTVLARKAPDAERFERLAQVPEEARERANPLRDDPDTVAAGRKLYQRHCAECHGAMGENGRKGPSLRAAEVQTATDGALFWAITNGNVRAGMPVWSKLPEPQRWQVTTYIKSLGAVATDLRPPM
jgi:mono/diheme cytochrome c family protein